MMFGAAAVTIPLGLHFFYRARYRPLPWAPMKFLKEAVEQTSRRLKFQEWILLALRCIALILLALALAQPRPKSAAAGGAGQPVDAVFVFDTSFSMAAKEGGDKTRLELAKDAALGIIDTLPDKSSVQIFACSDRAVNLGPLSSTNRDQAKQIVQALETTSLSTDLYPGLNEALTAAEGGTATVKEVYVFTDMQRSGLERQQGAVKSKCEDIKAKGNLIFVRCGDAKRKVANVAVLDVQLLATIPHTKTRVPFKVTLKNTGREKLRGVKVALELDGRAVEKDAVQVDEIEPGAFATVTLTGALEEAGPRLVAVRVEGDGLDGDNVLYRVIGVRDKVRVLMVAHPFAGQNVTDGGDWFARKALVPFDADRDREKIERYFIETQSVAPNEAGPDILDRKDIVYLLNAAARTDDPLEGMSPPFVDKLVEFVKAGGGLIIGCGDDMIGDGEKGEEKAKTKREAYNRVLGEKGLLPLPILDVRNTTEAALFTPSAGSIEEASVFGPMKPFAEWLERAQLIKMLKLDDSPAAAAGARVLLRTADGAPLVASRALGAGEVVFFATSLDETWGRMMSDGQLAIPMTQHLVAHLTSRKVPGGTRTVGDTLTFSTARADGGFELIKPRPKTGDRTRPRVKLGDVKEVDGRIVVSSSDTALSGEYAIVPTGAPDPTGLESETGVAFVANPDLRESENLDAIADADVDKMLGFRPTIIAAGADTGVVMRERRTHGGWTEYVLLFLLLLLVGEAAWAWFCGRAW
jgi:hypothetical protein